MVTKTIQAIKEGQIYVAPKSNFKLVIKSVTPTKMITITSLGEEQVVSIKDYKAVSFIGMQLVARYKTWQEAVNSKEFNDVE